MDPYFYYVEINPDTYICWRVWGPRETEWTDRGDYIIDTTSDVVSGLHEREWYLGKKLEYGEWVEGPPPPVEEVPELDQKVAALEAKVAIQQNQINALAVSLMQIYEIPE